MSDNIQSPRESELNAPLQNLSLSSVKATKTDSGKRPNTEMNEPSPQVPTTSVSEQIRKAKDLANTLTTISHNVLTEALDRKKYDKEIEKRAKNSIQQRVIAGYTDEKQKAATTIRDKIKNVSSELLVLANAFHTYHENYKKEFVFSAARERHLEIIENNKQERMNNYSEKNEALAVTAFKDKINSIKELLAIHENDLKTSDFYNVNTKSDSTIVQGKKVQNRKTKEKEIGDLYKEIADYNTKIAQLSKPSDPLIQANLASLPAEEKYPVADDDGDNSSSSSIHTPKTASSKSRKSIPDKVDFTTFSCTAADSIVVDAAPATNDPKYVNATVAVVFDAISTALEQKYKMANHYNKLREAAIPEKLEAVYEALETKENPSLHPSFYAVSRWAVENRIVRGEKMFNLRRGNADEDAIAAVYQHVVDETMKAQPMEVSNPQQQ